MQVRDSNTTLVKVKLRLKSSASGFIFNSNTTLVKVKYVVVIAMHGDIIIQIQHLLKLNLFNVFMLPQSQWQIQIQHLLKLN